MGFRTPTFGQFNQQQQAQDKEEMQPIGKRQKGTGFTNIGKILGANIGAGERIGGQVGKGIGAQAGQLKMGTTEAQKKFQQSREEAAGKAREAIGGIGQYLGNEAGLAGMTEEQAKAAREKFQKEGTYTGPSGIQDQAQLQARSQALGGLAGTAMSGATGERGLLRSMVAGPGMYTRGQSLLDTALLGQSEAGKRAIRSAAQQASTAARTTESAIGGAKEQAAATQKAIGKERENVLTKTAEKLEDVESSGGKAAKQFADDINRFNTLMLANKTTDKEGNTVYKDAAGNILEVTDRDRDLISNPQQFGLGAQDIMIDQNINLQGILQDIANAGSYTYKEGQRRYSPEQEKIARNLALFKGETPKEYSPFETDIFKTSGENIEQKSQSYRALEDKRKGEVQSIADSVNKMFTGQPRIDASKDILPQIENIKKEVEDKLRKTYELQMGTGSHEYGPAIDSYTSLLNDLTNKQTQYKNLIQNRQTTSLENYLKNLYGLQTSPGEMGRGPSGRTIPIVQK